MKMKRAERIAAIGEASNAWIATKYGSQKEQRAFRVWLNLCTTSKEFVEIYRATKHQCHRKFAVVIRMVMTLKSLTRIHNTCKKCLT